MILVWPPCLGSCFDMDQAVRGRAVGSSLIPGTLRLPPSEDTGAKRLGTAEEVARESWPRLAARTTDCILTVICSEMFTLVHLDRDYFEVRNKGASVSTQQS